MKSKLKDYLLYSLACVGVVALFISATTLPQQTSTVPESHVWEMNRPAESSYGYLYNKVTGEVRKFTASSKTYIIPELKD